jgi:methyl-accepting chemotaxis protein
MVANINTSLDNLTYEKSHVEMKVEEAVRQSEEQKKYLARSVETMLDAMEKFSKGDLNVSLNASQDDLIGNLFKGFNKTVTNFKQMVLEVREAVEETASAGEQISSSTEEMAAGSVEQAQQATEIAGSVEEMTKTILQNTKNTELASSTALEAGQKARLGGKAVNDTIEEMDKIADIVTKSASRISELGKNSSQIGEIIQVIDDIADQTNLLALNAAIEAARAGEQGRGFAVVADEVRKLAERTTKATKEIAFMIKQIQQDTLIAVESINMGTQEVEMGKLLVRKADQVLEEIITGTGKVSEIINEVAHTSEKQASSSNIISKNIEAITAVAHQTSSGTHQIAKASADLARLTLNLKNLIDKFNINNQKDKKTGQHHFVDKQRQTRI